MPEPLVVLPCTPLPLLVPPLMDPRTPSAPAGAPRPSVPARTASGRVAPTATTAPTPAAAPAKRALRDDPRSFCVAAPVLAMNALPAPITLELASRDPRSAAPVQVVTCHS